MAVSSTTTVLDQRKFLAAKLIKRSLLKLVAASLCDKEKQPDGTGLTANFVRYNRMEVPVTPISEGVDPAQSSIAVSTRTVTLVQWGAYLILTDIARKTTAHPLMEQVNKLLADNAARVMDREIQVVWMAGTNVIYGDATVTSRAAITAGMTITDSTIQRAYITLADAGVPPRFGPSREEDAKAVAAEGSLNGNSTYVAVTDVYVTTNIRAPSTSFGTFAAVSTYANAKAQYNAEVGMWQGFRWVETNFIPVFSLFGGATVAVVSGANFGTGTPTVTAVNGGGTLNSATTYFFKVTRKDLQRGFEDTISIAHSMASAATGDNESFTFAFPSTSGYVYNLYFDSVQTGGTGTDATLFLHTSNIAAGTTVTVTGIVASGTNPPANTNPAVTSIRIHVVYCHGAESTSWVGFQDMQMFISPDEVDTGNPLLLRKTIGYKYMSQAMIRDETRIVRLELPSTFG